ncbi:MAG: ribosomal protein L7/L12 [Bacteroidaceae bacterium]|nr:ribosomal protein L7/L12 [Bacteroidaceae bacterium]
MYCPNCHKEFAAEFTGKFCTDCGTRLVESLKEGSTGLNISDNAAVMGGVNVTHNDSHNTTSFDQSVTYNSTVTNNINKSSIELQQERTQSFIEQCKQAFIAGNGLITEERRVSLETLRLSLGIDEAEAERLIAVARKSSGARMTALGLRDAMMLKNVDRFIKENDAAKMKGQIPRLAAIARDYNVEEVFYKYYLLLAALNPEELIKIYEKSVSDEYWQTYWVAIAYMKKKNVLEAESAISKLGHFLDYSEHNSLLLTVVSTYNEYGAEEAINYINELVPEECTPMLIPLLHAIYFEVAPERTNDISRESCQFFIDYILSLESPEDKEARRKAAEKEAAREAAKNVVADDDADDDINDDADDDINDDIDDDINDDVDDDIEDDEDYDVPEDECYDVVLSDAGVMKLAIVKALKDNFELGLKESKDIVDNVPCTLINRVSKEDAEMIRDILEPAGAIIEILDSETGALEYRTSSAQSYDTVDTKSVVTTTPAQTSIVNSNRNNVPQTQTNNNSGDAVDNIFNIINVIVAELLEALKRLVEFIRNQMSK